MLAALFNAYVASNVYSLALMARGVLRESACTLSAGCSLTFAQTSNQLHVSASQIGLIRNSTFPRWVDKLFLTLHAWSKYVYTLYDFE